MDIVPRLFTKAVQTQLLMSTGLSGTWELQPKKTLKRLILKIEATKSGCFYQIKCYDTSEILNLDKTALKDYELKWIQVNRSLKNGLEMNSKVFRALRGLIARTERKVFAKIFKTDNNMEIRSLLSAVPRYGSMSFYDCCTCTKQELFVEHMKTLRVDSIDIGHISLTQELCSQILAFTYNGNFTYVRFIAMPDGEISPEECFKTFWKRFCEIRKQGENVFLWHGSCWHGKNPRYDDQPSFCSGNASNDPGKIILALYSC